MSSASRRGAVSLASCGLRKSVRKGVRTDARKGARTDARGGVCRGVRKYLQYLNNSVMVVNPLNNSQKYKNQLFGDLKNRFIVWGGISKNDV